MNKQNLIAVFFAFLLGLVVSAGGGYYVGSLSIEVKQAQERERHSEEHVLSLEKENIAISTQAKAMADALTKKESEVSKLREIVIKKDEAIESLQKRLLRRR